METIKGSQMKKNGEFDRNQSLKIRGKPIDYLVGRSFWGEFGRKLFLPEFPLSRTGRIPELGRNVWRARACPSPILSPPRRSLVESVTPPSFTRDCRLLYRRPALFLRSTVEVEWASSDRTEEGHTATIGSEPFLKRKISCHNDWGIEEVFRS